MCNKRCTMVSMAVMETTLKGEDCHAVSMAVFLVL